MVDFTHQGFWNHVHAYTKLSMTRTRTETTWLRSQVLVKCCTLNANASGVVYRANSAPFRVSKKNFLFVPSLSPQTIHSTNCSIIAANYFSVCDASRCVHLRAQSYDSCIMFRPCIGAGCHSTLQWPTRAIFPNIIVLYTFRTELRECIISQCYLRDV
jgi:hypothetical protein